MRSILLKATWFAAGAAILAYASLSASAQAPAGGSPQRAEKRENKTLDQQLYDAIREGTVEQVQALLRAGANPNAPNFQWVPLSPAAARGDVEIVRALLQAGANPNGQGKNEYGVEPEYPPLSTAAERGRIEIMQLLIAAGANVNAGCPGMSAFWRAASIDHRAAARVLVEAGADLNAEIAFAEHRGLPDLVAKFKKYQGNVPAAAPESAEVIAQKLDLLATRNWSAPPANAREIEMPSEEEIAKTRAELDARVKAHPDDMKALLLWARLTPSVVTEEKAESPDSEGPVRKVDSILLHAALDRVLQAEPGNAEAHYRKGLLYGQTSEFYRLYEPIPKSMDLAIHHIRRAVELAPEKASYRETLAVFLAELGRMDEGIAILTPVVGAHHPMVAMLSDLEAIGIPAGAEFFPWHDISLFGHEALAERNINDYVSLRLRTYRLSMTPESLEAFYRGRFPGFKFFLEEEQKSDNQKETTAAEGRVFLQYFRWKDGGWKPTLNKTEIPNLIAPQDGLLLLFLELDPKIESQLGGKTASSAVRPEQPGRYLVLLNYRTTK